MMPGLACIACGVSEIRSRNASRNHARCAACAIARDADGTLLVRAADLPKLRLKKPARGALTVDRERYVRLGHDIGAADDPYSAGLGFTVALDKAGGFTGRDAVAALDPKAPRHRAVYVTLDDPQPVFVHDETVLADGVAVGRMTSGAYGHTLGRAVGIATIDPTVSLDASFAVECMGVLVPATVSRRPFYDPRGERLRG